MKFKTNNNSYSDSNSSINENKTPVKSKRRKIEAIINTLSPKFYYINHLGEIILSKNFK